MFCEGDFECDKRGDHGGPADGASGASEPEGHARAPRGGVRKDSKCGVKVRAPNAPRCRLVPVALAALPRRARGRACGRARSPPLTACFLRCSKLWHQATLAVEELAKDPCFSAEGNKDLLTLYDELVKDQPPSAQWSGFGSRMNAVKHAGACSCKCRARPRTAIAAARDRGGCLSSVREKKRAVPWCLTESLTRCAPCRSPSPVSPSAALAIRVSKQHGDTEAGIEEAIAFLEVGIRCCLGLRLRTSAREHACIRDESLDEGRVCDLSGRGHQAELGQGGPAAATPGNSATHATGKQGNGRYCQPRHPHLARDCCCLLPPAETGK